MSERTYAPRSGGRTAEARTTDTLRRTGGADARGARRSPAVTARTEGTSALRLDTAVTEPVRIEKPGPRLRVAPPAPIRAPRAPFIAVVIAIVVAGVLGILLINTKTMENSFELSTLQDEQTTLDKQQQQLENQLAGYESVGSLDAAAKRYGLVKGEPAYIRLPDGKIIGVPKPGQGQPAVTAQDSEAAPAAATQGAATQGAATQGAATQGAATQGAATQGSTQGGATQGGTDGAAAPGAGQ
jgi:hypothetical protein